MANFEYVGIGKIKISDALLDQVVASRLEARGVAPSAATPSPPTPASRSEALSLLKRYFVAHDND